MGDVAEDLDFSEATRYRDEVVQLKAEKAEKAR